MEQIEWEYSDNDSLARVSKLTVASKTVEAPFHATTRRDDDIYTDVVGNNRRQHTINVVPESLSKTTLDSVGNSIDAGNSLIGRLTQKKSEKTGDINIVYTRIPKRYEIKTGSKKMYYTIPTIDQLQITSLVDVALRCDTDIVVPPIPNAISSFDHFKDVLNRTKNQIQTFKKEKPIMGYIPNIDDRALVIKMIDEYLKKDYDCKIFGVDFSGSPSAPLLMSTVVATIRDRLKVKKKVEEYYLHVFNVATAKKSEKDISPVTNWLTHLYGVDSVSGTIWGGGGEVLETDDEKLRQAEKLRQIEGARYIVREDYGAYKKKAIHKKNCSCPVCSKYSIDQIYDQANYLKRIKAHTIANYKEEYVEISEKIRKADKKLVPYIDTKSQVVNDAKRIMYDVNEIRARTGT